MKICKRCIQLDTRPGIFFKDELCGACIWTDEKKHVNWDLRKKELFEISNWAKKNSTSAYDCVIGVSGGKDSTRQSLVARDELKLRCLLVNYEPEEITQLANTI